MRRKTKVLRSSSDSDVHSMLGEISSFAGTDVEVSEEFSLLSTEISDRDDSSDLVSSKSSLDESISLRHFTHKSSHSEGSSAEATSSKIKEEAIQDWFKIFTRDIIWPKTESNIKYDVEKLVDMRWREICDGFRVREFRVRWTNYDESDDTWEPESQLSMDYNKYKCDPIVHYKTDSVWLEEYHDLICSSRNRESSS